MSRLRAHGRAREPRENTIPLINVVFLLLVFFIVAGSLSAPRDNSVELASARSFDPARLDPFMIYITAEGAMRVGGAEMSMPDAVAAASRSTRAHLTVVPDRDLGAARMLAILAELRGLTDRPLEILTRRPAPSAP